MASIRVRRVRGVAILGGLAVLLALGGCTGDQPPGEPTSAVVPATPVPAPGGGDVNQTVAPSPTPSRLDVRLGAVAEPVRDVKVSVSGVSEIEAKAQGPGEVSGPAVAVSILIENGTGQELSMALLNVNLEDSKGLPGSGMIAEPADWVEGSIPAGGRATGVYVFAVPKANRAPIRVSVSIDPALPTSVFTGDV